MESARYGPTKSKKFHADVFFVLLTSSDFKRVRDAILSSMAGRLEAAHLGGVLVVRRPSLSATSTISSVEFGVLGTWLQTGDLTVYPAGLTLEQAGLMALRALIHVPGVFSTFGQCRHGAGSFTVTVCRHELVSAILEVSRHGSRDSVLLAGGEVIGGVKGLVSWAREFFSSRQLAEGRAPSGLEEARADMRLEEFVASDTATTWELAFSVQGKPLTVKDDVLSRTVDRVVVLLFNELAPKMCAAFTESITKNESCAVHRVVEGGWVQMGDFVDGSGVNAGPLHPVENYAVRHGAGAVGLARVDAAEGTMVGSQFYITLTSIPSLNAVSPVIGQVVSGESLLAHVAGVEMSALGRPTDEVRVSVAPFAA